MKLNLKTQLKDISKIKLHVFDFLQSIKSCKLSKNIIIITTKLIITVHSNTTNNDKNKVY